MNISPARTAAFDILLRIEKDRAYSSVLLPQFESSLDLKDSSLCHEIVLGCLRKQIYLDRLLDSLTKSKKIDVEVRIAIRLGLYQLYCLDRIPQYSAINESVNLIQREKKTSAKGFVNAVLRKASRETPVLTFADDLDRLSVETSHPKWLIEKWSNQYGPDETAKLSAANNHVANTAFRVLRDGSAEVESLREDSMLSQFVDGCYIAAPFEHRLFDLATRGEIYLQDEASQMVGQAVFGTNILDVCAAPGGKTGLIARNGSSKTGILVAGDLHSARVETMKANLLRQGILNVSIIQYDAERELPFADAAFDAVLVDAPCSGTGTIRHNPEIRYSLGKSDFDELSRKQLAILKNASKLVRSGGSVVYSTCSLEVEENETVVAAFLDRSVDFTVVRPRIATRFVTEDSFGRTFPQRDDMDGFFIAELRRK